MHCDCQELVFPSGVTLSHPNACSGNHACMVEALVCKFLPLEFLMNRPFGWFLEVRGFRAAVRRQGGFGGERPKWSPAVGGIFFWYLRGYSKECLYRIAYVSTPALKKKDL